MNDDAVVDYDRLANEFIRENFSYGIQPDGSEYFEGPLGLRMYKFGTGHIPNLISVYPSRLKDYLVQLGDA